ncbi:unnamed protein product [Rotaria socialis]|uniref:RRM domain-containing protein n=1 Tax=Rotaria socialis TaxID=392032 RepID=A0A821DKF4_9BILA|nr:unnamed protein product [Rotaria socialis]
MNEPTKIVKTKLFIGNLDPTTQPVDELNDLFSTFGSILEASVIKDYGFVHYGSIEEAEKAVLALNNKEFHGKRLRVELSTSTVRHRPGQPEPASALRHSRARVPTRSNNNGVHRYSSNASVDGVGPIRHNNNSAWTRQHIRPYASVPIDRGIYDRPRSYNVRLDPRRYYEDEHDNSYDRGYDASRYDSSIPIGPSDAQSYRDLPPHVRVDDYGPSRSYDRHLSAPAIDPYYGGGVSQVPSPAVDPYHNYDLYEKFYASRPRDPEFPVQRAYNIYSNYCNDPYTTASSHGSLRHDLPVGLQQPQGLYPPSHRQHQSYTSASYNSAQYYGAQQH